MPQKPSTPVDDPSIEPLEREQRLYERVADKILGLISSGTWAAGDRLPPERELCDSFGVSRTVVREAVKALEARGVLESTTGSGVTVRPVDFTIVSRSLQTYMQLSSQTDFYIRLNEVRRVVEVDLVALAAERITTEQCAQLRTICQQMRSGGKDARQMAELDFQLHVTLAEATQNDLFKVLLAPLIDQLRDQITLTWEGYPHSLELVLNQHEAIVNAVENGDAAAARQAMFEHLDSTRGILEGTASKEIAPGRKPHLHLQLLPTKTLLGRPLVQGKWAS